MNTPYLVQRGTINKNALQSWLERPEDERHSDPLILYGQDALVRLDYMGAAEFEWGALPKSLTRMAINEAGYTMKKTDLVDRGQTVWVFGPDNPADDPTCRCYGEKPHMDEIIQMLKDYLEEVHSGGPRKRFRLKEYISFGDTSEGDRDDFWWDILNDTIWFLGTEKTAEAVTYSIIHLLGMYKGLEVSNPERWKELVRDSKEHFGHTIWDWRNE